MSKVILILSDALRYDAAVDGMGYLGHLVENNLASLYKVTGKLPSMSRPMYETLHTGLPVFEHGVVSNYVFSHPGHRVARTGLRYPGNGGPRHQR